MNPKKIYKFCPKCGKKLIPKKDNVLECAICHFHLYINPLATNGVIIENRRGEILLVKRAFPPKKGWWDVPGGFIQPGETIEASVKRELKEELNVEIVISRIVGIYTDTYLFESVTNYTLCIMAAASIVGGKLRAGDDAAACEFIPKKKILGQKIAFAGVRRGLEDYIKAATSLPNLTA